MQMKLTFLATLILSTTLVACGSSSSTPTADGDAGGDTASGDAGGDTTGSDTGADTTGGDTGGDTTGDGSGTDTGTVGGGSSTITGNPEFLGIVNVDQDTSTDEVEVGAFFTGFAGGVLGSLVESELRPTLDVCTVDTFDTTDGTTDFPIDTDVEFSSVSAGEVLPLTSAAGTYVQLMRDDQFGFVIYTSDPETITGSIPSQLSVNIPGDVFPGFGDVSIPTVETLNVTSPLAGAAVTPSTTFSWTPGSNPDGFVVISVTSFSGGSFLDIDCEVADDGQFSFPAATQAEVGAGFTSSFYDIERIAFSLTQQGNAVLLVSSSSAR